MEKKILGLDLGPNSIGWALISTDESGNPQKIEGLGSRIIPMTQDALDNFNGGKPLETQTAIRTSYRGIRRIRERHLLRRERLHRVLNVLGFLPEHYAQKIDFEKHKGQFVNEAEPKIAYNNGNFIFKESFEEMLKDFKQSKPQLFNTKPNGKETKIPYDWTIYFLRKKALTQKIAKEELAWIILNFNRKRGYYQRTQEEQNKNIREEILSLKIIDVKKKEDDNNDNKKNRKPEYSIILENGLEVSRKGTDALLDWKDTTRDVIVTYELNDDGTIKKDKDGKEKRRLRFPKEDDWELIKKKTEDNITKSGKHVGTYIYDNLLKNPSQKIRGKLIHTIERKFYKEELIAILKKQIELQPELFTDDLYNDCVRELYKNNETHQFTLSKRDFVHLFVEDIIFYQRPLKSKKSLIGNCKFEYRIYKDKDGNLIKKYLKVIPKSHPLYQEYRVWQWLSNLKIYCRKDDTDVTSQLIKNNDDKVALFEFLMTQKEVGHIDILKHLLTPILKEKYPNAKANAFKKELDKEIAKYRWNYVFYDSKDKEEDKSKKYPCNTTGYEIRQRLNKVSNVPVDFLTPQIEQHLWHIIYSVIDKREYEAALKSFAKKYKLDVNTFVEKFKSFPPFPSQYGAYSEKAIKKLLSLMRIGKYWSWDNIDNKIKNRIEKIITGEYDENVKARVREKAINLTDFNHFQGLPNWLASYVIYDRHSEADIAGKWNSVDDIEQYLQNFKQHSLHNPIVEQIVTETLRVVRDIWKQYGQGTKNFFNEIHIELGREMKNTAEDRKRLTEQNTENEKTNQRIIKLLKELKKSNGNINPFSSKSQERLKIYEDFVLKSKEIPDEIEKTINNASPTQEEIERYIVWLEQKYQSPYTGEIIPLSELFTEKYQVDHIIPQSIYFDDSFNNKVICEAAINLLKGNQMALEFIRNHSGERVDIEMGKTAKILSEDEYRKLVEGLKNPIKRKNLLLEEIPDKMIARQINDTRYISRFISSLLSNIVRADDKDDGINSKNLIQVNGKITNELKKDWGLDEVWDNLILPRFQRLNKLINNNMFTRWDKKYQKELPECNLFDNKKIDKKRIDYRHHAMDALVIACTTRDHVNLLNNMHAKSPNQRYDLQNKLRYKERKIWKDPKTHKIIEGDVFTKFKKPWHNFESDAQNALQNVIVSFKQNRRVITKTTNYYEKWVEKDGKKVKVKVKQEGTNWAIRKPLHKETVFGLVKLKDKPDEYVATRKSLDITFNLKQIESITDKVIRDILKNHLKKYNEIKHPELVAFSPEGIENMNNNIIDLNKGKYHKPIYKVRCYEAKGNKFIVGLKGNKKTKYVEAAKGTNLYFAIYSDESNEKSFETIPLNIVIERLKQGLLPVPETNNKGHRLLFHLSPNDLVYVPTQEEIDNKTTIDISHIKTKPDRIYRFVDSSKYMANFVPMHVASVIFDMNKKEQEKINIKLPIQNEYGLGGPKSKSEKSIDEIPIKYHCIKLKVDRLGNISLR